MFRRQVIRNAGVVLAGSLAVSGSASAGGDGERPNDNVAVRSVHPFSTRGDPIEVRTGEWVRHRVGWVDSEGDGGREGAHESTRADVERWLEAKVFSAWIDGQEIEDADDRWTEPSLSDGTWETWWEYYTPPKSPGLHTFRTRWHYPDGFTDGQFTIAPGATAELTGFYEVVPRGGTP